MNVAYLCPSKHWKNAQICTDEDKCVLCEIDRLRAEVEKLTIERDELKRDVDTLWDSITDMEVE